MLYATRPLKNHATRFSPKVKKMNPTQKEDRIDGKEDDWAHPCRDCVFRHNEDGCALGCSLLLLWTKEEIKG